MNQPAPQPHPLPRRDFIGLVAAAATVASVGLRAAQPTAALPKLALGLDAHSVRGMGWKARQLIDYAAEQRLDAVLFNTLKPLESLETTHLRALRETAEARGLRKGGSVFVGDVDVRDPMGTLVATGRATYRVWRNK